MPRPFLNTLAEVRAGVAVAELDESLADVVHAVRRTGKSGELTLKITVKPASKGDVSTLFVDADVKAKLPRLDNASTVFFADSDNSLTRTDPRQQALELRVAPIPDATPRTVEAQ